MGVPRFAVKMPSRRDADNPDDVLARERRPVLPVGASHRHRPAQRGERAYPQPRRSAGTAWRADLWAVLPVGPGTRWPPASARRIGKRRRGSPLGTCPTGRTLVIGSARSPRPHEKGAALTLAGPGIIGAGFALPRDAGRRPVASSPGGGPLSRAIVPLRGTRREGSHPDGWGLSRRGPAGRCADGGRRSLAYRTVLPAGGRRS